MPHMKRQYTLGSYIAKRSLSAVMVLIMMSILVFGIVQSPKEHSVLTYIRQLEQGFR